MASGTGRDVVAQHSARVAILTDQFRAVGEQPSTEPVPPPLRQRSRLAHRERARRALEERLDLLLQRACIPEDFILGEKLTHFDHERIPERIVHARGSAAHGVFECHESLVKYTRAAFLSARGKQTPVFVRFSTVAGERGSTDTPRDVRGFATKFYTEGNFDLVG